MMKRILSLFLCLVLLISAVPVQVFAAGQDGGDIILGENELPPIPIDPEEPEEPKVAYVVSETVLSVGTNVLTLDPGAESTIYAFEATEKAIYSFSASNGNVGFWGSSEWFLTNPHSTSSTFEKECWEGPTFFIGITGEGSCTLTITKAGEAKPERQHIVYEVQDAPNAKVMSCYTVDGTGDQLVVNFAASTGVNLNEVIGGPGNIVVLADNNYDYVDYRSALEAYSEAAKGAGNYYLLTDELAMILSDLYNYENTSWDSLMASVEELYEKASVNHTPGEAVEEDGFLNTYCANCAALISSEPAASDDTVASGKTEDLTWKLSEEGVLTLSGEGYSGSYSDTDAPWAGYAQQITSIVVEEGASVLGDYLFENLSKVTTVSLPDSLSGIGAATFSGCSSLKSVHIPAKVDTAFYWAFAYCDSLTEFTVDPANPWFYAENGVLCY